MITLLIILLTFGGLILVHEIGHWIAAVILHEPVERLSVGFPPKLFGIRVGGTDYCLSAILLGGYVEIFAKYSAAKIFWRRQHRRLTIITLAGPAMNFLFAIPIFFIIAWSAGMPASQQETIVGRVLKGMPADSIGLAQGDRILLINDTPISKWKDITKMVGAAPGAVKIAWERSDSIYSAAVMPVTAGVLHGMDIKMIKFIGIMPVIHMERPSPVLAMRRAGKNTASLIKITVVWSWKIIIGKQSLRTLGGPVSMAKMARVGLRMNVYSFWSVMAILSINLGILNLLPLAVFDGGKTMILLVELMKRKLLSERFKKIYYGVSLAFILVMMVLVFGNEARIF